LWRRWILAVGFPSSLPFMAERLTAAAAHAERLCERVPHLVDEQKPALYRTCAAFSRVPRSQSKLTVAGTV
jgi:hypothetical protein